MATIDQHCEDCIKELGKPYREVHIWLDKLFPIMGPKHRQARHHKLGLNEAFKLFGEEGRKAAEIHLKRDWELDFDHIPDDREVERWYVETYFGIGTE
jgi:hypothetical protein